jgi:hypothetical protein
MSATRNRPITDFYEFYWAHNMRDNKFADISSWLLKLLFTSSRKIPKRLISVWWTIWSLLVFTTVAAILTLLFNGADKLKIFLSPIVILPAIYSMIVVFLKNSFLNSVGDAGRYFTPSPCNVGERSKIRQQGLSFLKKLHQRTGNEKYDRIIIVAHSLGTVLAYDLIRILWTEYHDSHGKPTAIDQSAIKEIELYSNGTSEITNPNKFQTLQNLCWYQQKEIGSEWLISDFITLGSPLCNADYLIASNISIDDLREQREFPVCPPVADDKEKTIHYNSAPFETPSGKRTVKILHHAALFAVTRWTNIYFSSDYIGGPIQPMFGKGVRDMYIKRKSPWFYPGGHTHYWDIKSEESLRSIVNAMRL